MERLKAMRLTDKLCKKFEKNLDDLKARYSEALSFTGRPTAAISEELVSCYINR